MLSTRIINCFSYPLSQHVIALSTGLDLRASLEQGVSLAPLEHRLIPIGLYTGILIGYEGQVRPRNGLATKQEPTTLNAPSTIGADCRGGFQVILTNLSQGVVEIAPGERTAQLVFVYYEQYDWIEVENLSDT